MKDAYYFSHDTNARHDPKCSGLIHEYGPEGYGVFWMMIEVLAEQKDYKLRKFPKLYESLAAQFSIEIGRLTKQIEALLHDYELLLQDEKFIWSDSLLRRMDEKDKKKLAKIEAGRKGGLKSGASRNEKKSNRSKLKQNEALLEANEPKESKVKESKVNNINNNVVVINGENKNNNDNNENCFKHFEKNLGTISSSIFQQINSYLDDDVEDLLIKRSIDVSIEQGARNWSYAKKILENCVDSGIKTLAAYEAREIERKNRKPQLESPQQPKKIYTHVEMMERMKAREAANTQ